MFDVSGIKVNVSSANGFNGGVNQFTLNGRFFELNDMIGNPKADSIIGAPFTDPSELESPTDQKIRVLAMTLVSKTSLQRTIRIKLMTIIISQTLVTINQ